MIRSLHYPCANCLGHGVGEIVNPSPSVSSSEKWHLSSVRQFRNGSVLWKRTRQCSQQCRISKQRLRLLNIKMFMVKAVLNMACMLDPLRRLVQEDTDQCDHHLGQGSFLPISSLEPRPFQETWSNLVSSLSPPLPNVHWEQGQAPYNPSRPCSTCRAREEGGWYVGLIILGDLAVLLCSKVFCSPLVLFRISFRYLVTSAYPSGSAPGLELQSASSISRREQIPYGGFVSPGDALGAWRVQLRSELWSEV